MSERKRLLMVTEDSDLATGYSTYSLEVLKRLAASGKYEVAELACYYDHDRRHPEVPWEVYPNTPKDRSLKPKYDSNHLNQFGLFSFNEVCLRFRPDVVFAIRDAWMDEFIARSPFRRHFRLALMPAVDSVPQHEVWISSYMEADAVLGYTDWGADVLRGAGGGLINVAGTASPGVDLDVFRPMDKAAVRGSFGMDGDMIVVGAVMRNQPRKLFPNLIDAFGRFIAAAPTEVSNRSYLYLHTSYPDGGWDIPALIKRSRVSHKILLTYVCRKCAAAFPSLFQDVRNFCIRCGGPAILPNVKASVDRETLARIFNTFDVKVQYANCEGFGLPMIEAAACGVPVMAVDYSAMSDVVRKLDGFPIRPLTLQMDPGLGTYRAIPDDSHLVENLIGFFGEDAGRKAEMSATARRGVERHYTWDMAASAWMGVFDGLAPAEPWDSSARIVTPDENPPGFTGIDEMVRWYIRNYTGRADMAAGYLSMQYVRDLSNGFRIRDDGTGHDKQRVTDFGVDDMVREMRAINQNFNAWETRRATAAGKS